MRRLFIALIALVGMGATGLAFADIADGLGIEGSPHDFTDNRCWTGSYVGGPTANTTPKTYQDCDEVAGANFWNDTGELCRVCHIPHSHGRSAAYMSTGLLWNRDLSTVTSWDPYDSASLEAAATSPDGLSLACLGCHDGMTSVSAFDTHSAGNGGTLLGPSQIIGGVEGNYTGAAYNVIRYGNGTDTLNDITSEHPISVVYDATTGTGMNPTTDAFDTGRTIGDRLEDGDTVQCHSCHDVHNNGVGLDAGGAGQYMLRLPVADPANPSQLCLTCHDK